MSEPLDFVAAYYAELERLSPSGLLGKTEPDEAVAVRAAVDAARAPLLARIAELEARYTGWKETTHYGQPDPNSTRINWHAGRRGGRDTVQRRVLLGPREPITTEETR